MINSPEDEADSRLARQAEAALAEGGATVSMAELLADLYAEWPLGPSTATSGDQPRSAAE